ncbi:MAG: DUF423 domain-containing protein [Arenimonas sp.]|nr:DUF423 domain-containing protein [Arenimonas sp.]
MTGLARGLAACGALACGASIALAAYASHGLDGDAARRAALAAALAFGHGLALLVLAPVARRRLGLWALAALLSGLCLFSGALLGSVFFATSTALAPAGGVLLMLGWLMLAVDSLRH